MGTGSSQIVLLLIQLPGNASEKAVEDDPSTWTLAPTWKILKRLLVPGFG